jgi:hypothetical protein
VDLVSATTLSWLAQRISGRQQPGAVSFSISSDTESAVTQLVQSGLEEAVREVVAPEQQDLVLGVVMGEVPEDADVQVAPTADLPQAVVVNLSPRLEILADQGLHVDSGRLAETLRRRIRAAANVEAPRGISLPFLAMLAGLPGTTFGDDDDDDDDDLGAAPAREDADS